MTTTTPQSAAPDGLLARHGAAMARHAKPVALISVLLAVAGYLVAGLGIGGPSLFSRLEVGDPVVAGEALTGRQMLADASPLGAVVQGLWDGVDPADPAVQQELTTANADLLAVPGVLAVIDPTNAGPAAVAADGNAVLVIVQLDKSLDEEARATASLAVEQRLSAMAQAVPGSTVGLSGDRILFQTITDQIENDLKTGELIALPVSLVVMVLIFGGFAAAGTPLAGAVASIAGGLVSLLAFTYVMELDATVVNVVTVLGLGLCIDYSLLIVSRYREQLHELHDLTAPDGRIRVPAEARQQAMAITMATAGRTVVFSGVTVAIAVMGLLFIDMEIIRSVGAGAVSVVLIAVVVATTFVPALLVLLTDKVAGPGMLSKLPGLRRFAGAFDHSPSDDGVFSRWARRVQRRPWVAFLASAAVLIVLAIPSLRMEFVSSGVELLPADNPAREAYTRSQEQFPAFTNPQVTVVAEDQAALAALAPQIEQMSGVERVGTLTAVGDIASLGVFTEPGAAGDVVAQIRAERPAEPQTWVTGQAAILADFSAQLRADAPWALLFIMGATLVLLFLLTGSVLVPVKALIMNVLSLGATFGVLVLIFQDGRLEGPLGFTSTGGIEATLPIIIFAFAFGLSMDYEVFLLSRIKEFHDTGASNDESVRLGLQRTGRIITSAALLIVIVFAGFIVGDLLAIKQTGMALAVAVLIDATLVRMVLVPATMTLLGEWNWWAPGPLRRLHARLGVAH